MKTIEKRTCHFSTSVTINTKMIKKMEKVNLFVVFSGSAVMLTLLFCLFYRARLFLIFILQHIFLLDTPHPELRPLNQSLTPIRFPFEQIPQVGEGGGSDLSVVRFVYIVLKHCLYSTETVLFV